MLQRLFPPVFAAVLAGVLAVPANAAVAPFNFDTTPGRLPKTVVPTAYRITLTPDAAAKTLSGREEITLEVRRPAGTIVFNTHDITISEARLDGTPVANVKTENDKQLTTLTLAHPASAGHHVLALTYAGKIEDSADGLFAQDYRKADGTTGRMLSTQFESTDARRMFPSWDEPAFRATFELTVNVPASWSVVSNTPVATQRANGALQTVTFGRTPRMPTYLVEFSGGDLAAISGVGTNGVKQTVWAVRGDEQNGGYTLASAKQILSYYDDYFGVKFPLPKLDHIAIPGGFGGAMENWGAITYNEAIIIHRPDASLNQKQRGYSIVAHEMAHQWNGDLVTMAWWDDIWLNESFASWMAAKATAKFNPDWNWWQGQADSKETAMNADARGNVHAIQVHVVDELQADASFDSAITYDKGQAFLRMLEAYLGEGTFRTGIRAYMQAHKYSNATTADLWNALTAASHKDVGALAKAWTEQPGYPLITVTASCDAAGNRTVALAQHRFLIDGTTVGANQRWNVPVGIASGNAPPRYLLLTRRSRAGSRRDAAASRCGRTCRISATTGWRTTRDVRDEPARVRDDPRRRQDRDALRPVGARAQRRGSALNVHGARQRDGRRSQRAGVGDDRRRPAVARARDPRDAAARRDRGVRAHAGDALRRVRSGGMRRPASRCNRANCGARCSVHSERGVIPRPSPRRTNASTACSPTGVRSRRTCATRRRDRRRQRGPSDVRQAARALAEHQGPDCWPAGTAPR